jgi:hypothetical protein
MLYVKLQYPTSVKDIDLDAHYRIFKKTIKANGEMVEINIINIIGFILKDTIFEWGGNFVQDHPNYIFEKLKQTFHKQFKTMKNDEEAYM